MSDVQFYLHNSKRKRPIARSTQATSDLLAILHEDNPAATIEQIRGLINFDPDAVAVCDAYIAHGEGSLVPNWR